MILLTILLSCVAASVLKETVDFKTYHEPQGWIRGGKPSKQQPHVLTFAFQMSELKEKALHDALYSVSDPQSSKYGQHWSAEQVNALSQPEIEVKQRFSRFVEQHFGVDIDWSDAGYATIETTVGDAERVLETSFELFSHKKLAGRVVTRTLGYSLPNEVSDIVAFVANTVRFPSMRDLVQRDVLPPFEKEGDLAFGVTPTSLRTLYNAETVKPKAKNVTTSFAQFIGQYWSSDDLLEFQTIYAEDLIGWTPEKTIGPNSGLPGIESDLDVQYLMGVSAGVRMIVYSTADDTKGEQEPFLTWVKAMLKQPDGELPNSISVSYGDVESGLSRAYAAHVCNEFAKVGLRGVSVLFAAGDSGASCSANGRVFAPDFPASCPFITTVGGTETGDAAHPEVVNSIGGSGFSNYFDQPDYQTAAVNKWLSMSGATAPKKFFNASGRAYPDVSAISADAWVVAYLIPEPVSGTSLACPTFNGIIALVNDFRARNKLSPLGFLNPMLYQQGALQFEKKGPSIFNQITEGCTMGCESNSGTGFCAMQNGYWSPAAGWGSPNYAEFIRLRK